MPQATQAAFDAQIGFAEDAELDAPHAADASGIRFNVHEDLAAVEREVRRQLPGCSRRALIEPNLEANGWLIQVRDLDQGVELVNRLAPEHCEVMTRRARAVSERIVTAGALFLGGESPTVLGDYVAGPSHTLPTGGAGNSFAGLTVDQFQRRTSVVEYSTGSLRKGLGGVATFARLEGLDAHGQSAAVRVAKPKKKR